jgi:hypothetical protein
MAGPTLVVEVAEAQAALRAALASDARAVVAGVKVAVRRQTDETKLAARRVVVAGLRQRGNRVVANSIRAEFYPDTPAGFVHSSWGYFRGGQFYDILGAHTHGAMIRPLRGKFLFIPFGPGSRKQFRNARGNERIEFVPLKSGGGLLVLLIGGLKRGRGASRAARSATPIGELVRQVTLRKRLDFSAVEADAERGLTEKAIVEIAAARQRGRA